MDSVFFLNSRHESEQKYNKEQEDETLDGKCFVVFGLFMDCLFFHSYVYKYLCIKYYFVIIIINFKDPFHHPVSYLPSHLSLSHTR